MHYILRNTTSEALMLRSYEKKPEGYVFNHVEFQEQTFIVLLEPIVVDISNDERGPHSPNYLHRSPKELGDFASYWAGQNLYRIAQFSQERITFNVVKKHHKRLFEDVGKDKRLFGWLGLYGEQNQMILVLRQEIELLEMIQDL